MFTKVLLKIAKEVLRQVEQEIANLIQNQLIDMVQQPIQEMVNSLGPDVWVGYGADAFGDECASLAIPETEGIQESCNVIIERIRTSTEIMDDADSKSQSLADQIAGEFAAIY